MVVREETIRAERGEYSVRIWEEDSGEIFASDSYTEEGEELASFENWEEALDQARICAKGNNDVYFTKLPVTPLSSGDICHWGLNELYPDAEKKLRELLSSGQGFDTGWGSCKHEPVSAQIIARDKHITVLVHQEMDDFPALVYDALPDDVEVDEDTVDSWAEDIQENYGINTEITVEREIPRTSTYEEVVKTMSELSDEADGALQDGFKVVRDYVSEKLRKE